MASWLALITVLFAGFTLTSGSYMITVPEVVKENSIINVSFFLNFKNTTQSSRVNLNLMLKGDASHGQVSEYNSIELTLPAVGKSIVSFYIPDDIKTDVVSLTVIGIGHNGISFAGSFNLKVQKNTNLIFIETDKPVYKPGQTVQFRVLVLDVHLKPKHDEVSEIYIQDAGGSRIVQWNDISLKTGLIELTLPLSKEPKLGGWAIFATYKHQELSRNFTVEEYVLPKFEVTVETPSYVMWTAEEFSVKTCANYTYGEGVSGNFNATLCINSTNNLDKFFTCSNFSAKLKGCHTQVVKMSNFPRLKDFVDRNHAALSKARIVCAIQMMEHETDVVINSTHNGPEIIAKENHLEFDANMPRYFKPGLSYDGTIFAKRYDGSPLVGRLVTLKVNMNMYNFTTDEKGKVAFTLSPSDLMGPTITLEAFLASPHDNWQHVIQPFSAEDHRFGGRFQNVRHLDQPFRRRIHHPSPIQQPTKRESLITFSIKSWYSPSGSYIQIQQPSINSGCDDNFMLPVRYTTHNGAETEFHFQIVSHGSVLYEGQERHGVQSEHLWATQSREKRMIMMDYDVEYPSVKPVILPLTASFMLEVPILRGMAPSARILVYYVREDGEMVADSIKIKMKGCLQNEMIAEFAHAELYPGKATTLKIHAEAGSLCAIGVVDKSVHLLGGPHRLTLENVLDGISALEMNEDWKTRVGDEFCEKQKNGHSFWRPSIASQYADSATAFKSMGLLVLTDWTIDMRPCPVSRPHAEKHTSLFEDMPRGIGLPRLSASSSARRRYQDSQFARVAAVPAKADSEYILASLSSSSSDDTSANQGLDLRHYFPETWLWQLVTLDDNGVKQMNLEVPHTVTEWVASGFCVHNESGLGIAEVSKLKAFQPFFVSLSLPYSVIRGENVSLPVKIFNYLNACVELEVGLNESVNYNVTYPNTAFLCVCERESVSHRFWFVPQSLGITNITVKAKSVKHGIHGGICGQRFALDLTIHDTVTRQLLVEAEGREIEITNSSFICPSDENSSKEIFNLEIPESIVNGSSRGYLIVTGDLMGPTLSGLDHLVRLPTGCGEQNMLNFAPNIFVLQYLNHTNQLNEEIEAKSLSYMRTGYQQELTYRHSDGSYSAFGSQDKEGSMWLTAFVVKCFAQAMPLITIDTQQFQQSLIWITHKQLENGCFPVIGTVIHKEMQGGHGHQPEGQQHRQQKKQSLAAITAYVLISLLESGLTNKNESVVKAIRCLKSEAVMDTYTLSLMTYALTLSNADYNFRNELLQRMEALAITKEAGQTYWTNANQMGTSDSQPAGLMSPSVSIETTAYMLLAYSSNKHELAQKGPRIVQWLNKQRNAYGGFASTQDTVVSLQALAKYASLVYRDNIDLTINVHTSQNTKHQLTISHQNALVTQELPLTVPNKVSISVEGTGCALIQTNLRYNVATVPGAILTTSTIHESKDAFQVNVTVDYHPNESSCRKQQINVCVRYMLPQNETGMAMISVKIVSGFIPVKKSVERLVKDNKAKKAVVEENEKSVQIYLESISKFKNTCIDFEIDKELDVLDPKPAFVEVYEYYNKNARSITKMYNVKTDCPQHDKQQMQPSSNLKQQSPKLIDPAEVKVKANNQVPIQTMCPMCFKSTLANVTHIYCSAKHAYKLEISNIAGRAPIRMVGDIKASTQIHSLLPKLSVPEGCVCDLIEPTVALTRLFIFTNETLTQADQIVKGHSTTVMQVSHFATLENVLKRNRRRCQHA